MLRVNDHYAKAMRRQDLAYIQAVYDNHPELRPPDHIAADPYPSIPIQIYNDMHMLDVAHAVARKRNLTFHGVVGKCRSPHFVEARWEIWWLCVNKLGRSMNAVAKAFGRDHTTIMYGVSRYNQRLVDRCQPT